MPDTIASSSSPPLPPEVGQLFEACQTGDRDALTRLLSAGVSLEHRNEEGKTPLMLAAAGGFEACTALLLEKRPDVNAQTAAGWSALHFAAVREQNVATIKSLVRARAKPETRDINGNTALILAASAGWADNAACLLDLGADIDAVNGECDTALACACRYQRGEVIKLLLARGADVARSDRHLISPLHWAVSRGDNEQVRRLINHGAPIDQDPVGCAPLVSWITRRGLNESSIELILRRSERLNEYRPVLEKMADRARRPDVRKILDRVGSGAGR